MERKIEIGLGKKEPQTFTSKASFEHKAKVVGAVVTDTAKVAVVGVCAYVILDTARQVVVRRYA